MERIEAYKLIAQVLLTRQYHLEEMQHVGPILDYLKQEIETHEPQGTPDGVSCREDLSDV